MFPELQTERFILRQITADDRQQLFKGLSDPVVIKYYGVSYRTIDELQFQLNWYDSLLKSKTGIWWAICYKSKKEELIGTCGFNNWQKKHKCTDMGYWLLPHAWNQGIMAECVSAIINYAFTRMDIHRIEAVVEQGNNRSSQLLRKLNFSHEGTFKECEIKNGQYISLEYYALLNTLN